MPSANKTVNLGLNLWGAGDTELSADLNADNYKIDAAFGNLGAIWVKLVDKTYTAATGSPYPLDMSGINLDDYYELIIYLNLNKGNRIYLAFDGKNTNYSLTVPGKSDTVESNMWLGNGTNRLSVSKTYMYLHPESYFRIYSISRSNFPTVSTFTFLCEGGGFLAGDRLVILGLKK